MKYRKVLFPKSKKDFSMDINESCQVVKNIGALSIKEQSEMPPRSAAYTEKG